MSDEDSTPKRKHKGGNPPFVPTPEQRLMVQILVSNGTPQEVIARNIHRQKGDAGIDEKTLRKCFRTELDHGYADTYARMGSTVVREGLKGPTCQTARPSVTKCSTGDVEQPRATASPER